MEDSPEQILARLERYAASVGVAAPSRAAAAATATIPSEVEPETRIELWRILLEATGYAVGVACSVLAILTFQQLGRTVATAVIAGLVVGGGVATLRRAPLALWWTLGFLVGGVIARLS